MKLKIIKLRHLLLNDPENSHDYIFKFLKQFFTLQEIGSFEDGQLKNFICSILDKGDSLIIDPRLNMRHFIGEALFGIPKENLNPNPSPKFAKHHFRSSSQNSLHQKDAVINRIYNGSHRSIVHVAEES